MDNKNTLLRQLPKIDKLIQDKAFSGMNPELVKIATRTVLENIRRDLIEKSATMPEHEAITDKINSEYERTLKGTLYKVINATGVPIHTNLGRSPLPEDVCKEAMDIACGYANLEYDVAKGKRGDRYHHVSEYLRILTGADDALIVNNNASAVFLILHTFAKNKEVIVSRGELVEIGGSFRVPDVMTRSGAKLKEVGTTNKTRVDDYSKAVSNKTAMMMKIHKSNYEIIGFSEEATLGEIAQSAKEADVMSYYDAGSGLFRKVLPDSICDDQTIPDIVKTGFDLISFSGDKMLGGTQAGIIIGSKALISKIKKNQLMRMFRVDKLTLALLQAVFRKYIDGSAGDIPVNKMLSAELPELSEKAKRLAEMLPCATSIIEVKSTIGGGSCPTAEIPSYGVALNIPKRKPQQIEKLMRNNIVPIIGRVTDDKFILDVRTLDKKDFETIKNALERII
ncbi:MAG: L-seryl-tRNA(Sec) selenium transferase [Denitrovibrio sp.]|nr:MAG: L-seryl-tRNA(Sec) selenium transferase [Denitrovibrio sp.]